MKKVKKQQKPTYTPSEMKKIIKLVCQLYDLACKLPAKKLKKKQS